MHQSRPVRCERFFLPPLYKKGVSFFLFCVPCFFEIIIIIPPLFYFYFGLKYDRAYSLRSVSPSLNFKPDNAKLASVEDFYTDIDKVTYDTDFASLVANIDIEKLMSHRKSLRAKSGLPQNRPAESEKLLCALGLTKEEIQSLTTNDEHDDTGSSLFDDPELLKEFPSAVSSQATNNKAYFFFFFFFFLKKRKQKFAIIVYLLMVIYIVGDVNTVASIDPTATTNSVSGNAIQDAMDSKSADETKVGTEEQNELSEMEQLHLDAALAYLNSTDCLETTGQDLSKTKHAHVRCCFAFFFFFFIQISEDEYSNMMRYIQAKSHGDPTRMTEAEKARINAAKEIFKHGGAEFLFMREHYYKRGHVRPKQYDLKADVEYNKGADFLLRLQNRQHLQKAAKVTNFHGLEPMIPIRPTVKPEEQEKIAESGKVSHFKGLQSSTKSVRTATVDETAIASRLASARSAFADSMKKKKQPQPQTQQQTASKKNNATTADTTNSTFVDVKT
ncbi:hypothetical protein RFI_31920 [Reticulomyxa filosa]|uniref:Uncharacterized protein n=1 Tax=Reticulomyxa filosa TaxID=46433 RepID=X6LXM4_RETFI|nr:hypothetical protein RFI_31920 [Reticulomyxa filosa]|eukprot:ETO05475.1 hypothetical protein RFI_31920 [Reticulomyxa filosa]